MSKEGRRGEAHYRTVKQLPHGGSSEKDWGRNGGSSVFYHTLF
jgi:hypothetical protein